MTTHTPARTVKRKVVVQPPATDSPRRARKPRLPQRVRLALANFQRRLLAEFPDDITQITLFGSYARSEATPDSDVDVLVVVKWRQEQSPGGRFLAWFGDPRWERVMDAATDVLLEDGVYISPLVMGEARVAGGNETVLHVIQREGTLLWKIPQI